MRDVKEPEIRRAENMDVQLGTLSSILRIRYDTSEDL